MPDNTGITVGMVDRKAADTEMMQQRALSTRLAQKQKEDAYEVGLSDVHPDALVALQQAYPDMPSEFRPKLGLIQKGIPLAEGIPVDRHVASGRVWLDPMQHGNVPGYGQYVKQAGWYDPQNPGAGPDPTGAVVPGGVEMGFNAQGKPTMRNQTTGAWYSSPGLTGGARGWFHTSPEGVSTVAPAGPPPPKTAVQATTDFIKGAGKAIWETGTSTRGAGNFGIAGTAVATKPLAPSLTGMGAGAYAVMDRVINDRKALPNQKLDENYFNQEELNRALVAANQAITGMSDPTGVAVLTSDGKPNEYLGNLFKPYIKDGKLSRKDYTAVLNGLREQGAAINTGNYGEAFTDPKVHIDRQMFTNRRDEYEDIMARNEQNAAAAIVANLKDVIAVPEVKGAGLDPTLQFLRDAVESGRIGIDVYNKAIEVSKMALATPDAVAKVNELRELAKSFGPTETEKRFQEAMTSSAGKFGSTVGGIVQMIPALRGFGAVTSLATPLLTKATGKGLQALAARTVTSKLGQAGVAAAKYGLEAAPGMAMSAFDMGLLELANATPDIVNGKPINEVGKELIERAPLNAAFGNQKFGNWIAKLGIAPSVWQQVAKTASRATQLSIIGLVNDHLQKGTHISGEEFVNHFANIFPMEIGFGGAHGAFNRKAIAERRTVLDSIGKARLETPDVAPTGEGMLKTSAEDIARSQDSIQKLKEEAKKAETPEKAQELELMAAIEQERLTASETANWRIQELIAGGWVQRDSPKLYGVKGLKQAKPVEPVEPAEATAPVWKPEPEVEAAKVEPTSKPATEAVVPTVKESLTTAPEPFVVPSVESINKTGGGWKLHLNVAPENKVAVDEALKAMGVMYKMDRAVDPYKDFTVYLGSRDSANAMADKLNGELGDLLLPHRADVIVEDMPFNAKVIGRFDIGKADSRFHQYGDNGVPAFIDDVRNMIGTTPAEHAEAFKKSAERAKKTLTRDYGEYFTGTGKQVPEGIVLPAPKAMRAPGKAGLQPSVEAAKLEPVVSKMETVEPVAPKVELAPEDIIAKAPVAAPKTAPAKTAPEEAPPGQGPLDQVERLRTQRRAIESSRIADSKRESKPRDNSDFDLEFSPLMDEGGKKSKAAEADKKAQAPGPDGEMSGYRFKDAETVGKGLRIDDGTLIHLLEAEGKLINPGYGIAEEMARRIEAKANAAGTSPVDKKLWLKNAAALRDEFRVPVGYESKNQAQYASKDAEWLRAKVKELRAVRGTVGPDMLKKLADDGTPFETENFNWIRSEVPQGIESWVRSDVPSSESMDAKPIYRMVPVPKPEHGLQVGKVVVKAWEGGNQTFERDDVRYDQNVHIGRIKDVLAEASHQRGVHSWRASGSRPEFVEGVARANADNAKIRYVGQGDRAKHLEAAQVAAKEEVTSKPANPSMKDGARPADNRNVLKKIDEIVKGKKIEEKSRDQERKELVQSYAESLPENVTLNAAESKNVLKELGNLYIKQSKSQEERIMREIEAQREFQNKWEEHGRRGETKTATEYFKDVLRAKVAKENPDWDMQKVVREANRLAVKGSALHWIMGPDGTKLMDRMMEAGIPMDTGPLAKARAKVFETREGYRPDQESDTFKQTMYRTNFTLKDPKTGKEIVVYGNKLKDHGYEWVEELATVRPSDVAEMLLGFKSRTTELSDGPGGAAPTASLAEAARFKDRGVDVVTHTGFTSADNEGVGIGPEATKEATTTSSREDRAKAFSALTAPHVFDTLWDYGVIRPEEFKPGYDYFHESKRSYNKALQLAESAGKAEGEAPKKTGLAALVRSVEKEIRDRLVDPEIGNRGYLPQLADKVVIDAVINGVQGPDGSVIINGLRDVINEKKNELAWLKKTAEQSGTEKAVAAYRKARLEMKEIESDLREEDGDGVTTREHLVKANREAHDLNELEQNVLLAYDRAGTKLGSSVLIKGANELSHEFRPEDLQKVLDPKAEDHLKTKNWFLDAFKAEKTKPEDIEALGPTVDPTAPEPVKLTGEKVAAEAAAFDEAPSIPGFIEQARREVAAASGGSAAGDAVVNRAIDLYRKAMGIEGEGGTNILGLKKDFVLKEWESDPRTKHLVGEYQTKLEELQATLDQVTDPQSMRETIERVLLNRDYEGILGNMDAAGYFKKALETGEFNQGKIMAAFNAGLVTKVPKAQREAVREAFSQRLDLIREAFNQRKSLIDNQAMIRTFLGNIDPRIVDNLTLNIRKNMETNGRPSAGVYDGLNDVVSLGKSIRNYFANSPAYRKLFRLQNPQSFEGDATHENRLKDTLNIKGKAGRQAAITALHEIGHFLEQYVTPGISEGFRKSFEAARREWLDRPENAVFKAMHEMGGLDFAVNGVGHVPTDSKAWNDLTMKLEPRGDEYYHTTNGIDSLVARDNMDGTATLLLPSYDAVYQWKNPSEFFAVVGSNLLDKAADMGRFKASLKGAPKQTTLIGNLLDISQEVGNLLGASLPKIGTTYLDKFRSKGYPDNPNASVLPEFKARGESGKREVTMTKAVGGMMVDLLTDSRHFDPTNRAYVETPKGPKAATFKTQDQYEGMVKRGEPQFAMFGEPNPDDLEASILEEVKKKAGKAGQFIKDASTAEDMAKDFRASDKNKLLAAMDSVLGQVNSKFIAGTNHPAISALVTEQMRQMGESTMDQMAVAEETIFGEKKVQSKNLAQTFESRFGVELNKAGVDKAIKAIQEQDLKLTRKDKPGRSVIIDTPNGKVEYYVNDARTIAIAKPVAETWSYLENRGRGKYETLDAETKQELDQMIKVLDERNNNFYEELRNNPEIDQKMLEQFVAKYGPDGKLWIPRRYGDIQKAFSGYTHGVDDAVATVYAGTRIKKRGFENVMDAIKTGHIPEIQNPLFAWLEGRRQQRTLVGYNQFMHSMNRLGFTAYASPELIGGDKDWVRFDAPMSGWVGKMFGFGLGNAYMTPEQARFYEKNISTYMKQSAVAEVNGERMPEFPVKAHMYVRREIAPLVRSFYGEGLSSHEFFKKTMQVNGTMNAFQLLGPFHGVIAGGVFNEAWRTLGHAKAIGRGLKQLAGHAINLAGQKLYAGLRETGLAPSEAAETVARQLDFSTKAAGATKKGTHTQQLLMQHSHRSPAEIQADPKLSAEEKVVLSAAQTSGINPMRAVMMEQQAKLNMLETMADWKWTEPGFKGALQKTMAIAKMGLYGAEMGIQKGQANVMGGIVARVKLGLFTDGIAELVNKKYDTKVEGYEQQVFKDLQTDSFLRRESNRLADRLDDVFGMVNLKKLGMNPKLKGLLQMIERAYGWHHGTNRIALAMLSEGAGAATSPLKKVGLSVRHRAADRRMAAAAERGDAPVDVTNFKKEIYGLEPDSPNYALRFGAGHMAMSGLINTFLVAMGIAKFSGDKDKDNLFELLHKTGYVTFGKKNDRESKNPMHASTGYYDEWNKLFTDPAAWTKTIVGGGKSPALQLLMDAATNMTDPNEWQRSGFTARRSMEWTPIGITKDDTHMDKSGKTEQDRFRDDLASKLKEEEGEVSIGKRLGRVGLSAANAMKPMSLGASDRGNSPVEKALIVSGILRPADRAQRMRLSKKEEKK